jgi:hypothetical protein
MKETAKALVSENQNELPAVRKLEVSLDRADNVIEGGPRRGPVLNLRVPHRRGSYDGGDFNIRGGLECRLAVMYVVPKKMAESPTRLPQRKCQFQLNVAVHEHTKASAYQLFWFSRSNGR